MTISYHIASYSQSSFTKKLLTRTCKASEATAAINSPRKRVRLQPGLRGSGLSRAPAGKRSDTGTLEHSRILQVGRATYPPIRTHTWQETKRTEEFKRKLEDYVKPEPKVQTTQTTTCPICCSYLHVAFYLPAEIFLSRCTVPQQTSKTVSYSRHAAEMPPKLDAKVLQPPSVHHSSLHLPTSHQQPCSI